MKANIFFKSFIKNIKLDFEIQTNNVLVSSVGALGIMSSKETLNFVPYSVSKSFITYGTNVIGKLTFFEIFTLHKQIRKLKLIIMLSPYTHMFYFSDQYSCIVFNRSLDVIKM